jgi:RNA polymerase sigma-70 factor (ECF subfamily)
MDEPLHLVPDAGLHTKVAPAPFEAFVEDHQARLFGALCLVTGDRFEAEEIAQEAFLRVFERWGRVSAMDEPAGYLFRVAMNVFRTRRRRAALALRRAIHVAPAAEDEFALAEDRETVLHGLAQVSEDQRAALVATALYGLSSEEAGKVLGIKPSTVRARATRARSALRDAIGEER